jgi:hypothetical protein
MLCFQTKNTNLGKFSRVFHWNELVYFMVIWSILHLFDTFYDHLVDFFRFGTLCPGKSGSPAVGTVGTFLCFFELRKKFILNISFRSS